MQTISTSAILGAGAIGASIASKIFDAGKNVCIIAQGARKSRYEREGFVVNEKEYSFKVVDTDSSNPVDLLIVAVKNYNLDESIVEMRPFVGPNTVIVSLLNGVDAVPKLRAAFGPERVPYGMIIGIDAHRSAHEIHFSAKGQVFCGFEKTKAREKSSMMHEVQRFFKECDIECSIPDDIQKEIWFKFMINVAVNQWSAVLSSPYALFLTSDHAASLLTQTMREVIAIAKKQGIELFESDISRAIQWLGTLNPMGKTSMLQDVEAKRPTEIEAFAGAMVRFSEEKDVPTPINAMLYEAIRAIEDSYNLPRRNFS